MWTSWTSPSCCQEVSRSRVGHSEHGDQCLQGGGREEGAQEQAREEGGEGAGEEREEGEEEREEREEDEEITTTEKCFQLYRRIS